MTRDPTTADAVELGVVVTATLEQAYDAVEELPDVRVWLEPAGVEARADGTIAVATGAGGTVRVVDREPPHRLVTEADVPVDGGEVVVTTTWRIESHDDGTTAVRVTTTAPGAGPAWDAEAVALRERASTALTTLAVHLEHFPGRTGTGVGVHAWGPSRGRTADSGHERAHARFLAQVGVVVPRQPLTIFRGVPQLSGTCLERRAGHHHSAALLLLDGPAPGVATLATTGTGPVHEVRAVLYGDTAAEVAERLAAQWSAWLANT
ncbi:MAG TPA: SRPBCC domain-containing protein [Actinomycetospora sp.]|uniref:SRPBCC domain-containing protein n=1 Tax=Actinomycetospora sp. TaxID=1872135 RepID=UPI002F3E891D